MKKILVALALLGFTTPALAVPTENTMIILNYNNDQVEVYTLKELLDRIGEVASSPTANTVLARLKTIADATNIASIIPGVTATNLGKAEDAAHGSGDTGVAMLAVRNDDFDTLTTTDGDYSPVAVTPAGAVIVARAPHAAMVRGNATSTNTSDFSVVAASGSGSLRTYITGCQVSNTGSATTLVTFKDGSGGSTLGYTVAAASGGGSNIKFDVPLATSLNTAFYAAAGSATSTLYVSCQGYKSP